MSSTEIYKHPNFTSIKAKVRDLFDHLGLLFSGFLAGLKRNQIEQLKKRNNIKSGRKAKNCETYVNITSKPSKSSKQDKSSDIHQSYPYFIYYAPPLLKVPPGTNIQVLNFMQQKGPSHLYMYEKLLISSVIKNPILQSNIDRKAQVRGTK